MVRRTFQSLGMLWASLTWADTPTPTPTHTPSNRPADTTGSAAKDRLNSPPYPKSQYRRHGQPLEVDTD